MSPDPKAQSTAGLCYSFLQAQLERSAKGSRMSRGCYRCYRWLGNRGSGTWIWGGLFNRGQSEMDEDASLGTTRVWVDIFTQ